MGRTSSGFFCKSAARPVLPCVGETLPARWPETCPSLFCAVDLSALLGLGGTGLEDTNLQT